MAILGVLAVVVLVAINPVQQLARTRDAGRKSGVTQLGHAIEAYYTARGGTHPAGSATWISVLTASGEIGTLPSAIAGAVSGYTACATNVQNNWCYSTAGGNAVIYTVLESQSEISKCASGIPFFVYSTADGRGGLVCTASEPTAANQSWNATQ